VRQVSGGFAFRVNSYNVYDVNGYRFHTTKYEEERPNRRTTNNVVCTRSSSDGVDYFGRLQEYTNSSIMVANLLNLSYSSAIGLIQALAV
jgi:hypothetical protein